MKRLFFCFAILIVNSSWAQISFLSETDLRTRVISQPSDKALNRYLWDHDMMNIRYRPFSEENDSILFDLDLMEIDVFKKNLFGDEREEMIVQLRQGFTIRPKDPLPRHRYWSVFILQQKGEVWVKVPGTISPFGNADTRQYMQPSFSFRFESIKLEETFNLTSSETYRHNLREEITKTIWEAGPKGIYPVISWTSYVADSRGDFRDDWHMKSTSTFSPDSWPRQLTIKSSRTSHHDMYFEYDDGSILDTLSGHRIIEKLLHFTNLP